MILQIKQATYYNQVWGITENGIASTRFDGKNGRFTVKNKTDETRNDDTNALIIYDFVVNGSSFTVELTIDETDIAKKKYKADIRFQGVDESDRENTDSFEIEITDKVTEQ